MTTVEPANSGAPELVDTITSGAPEFVDVKASGTMTFGAPKVKFFAVSAELRLKDEWWNGGFRLLERFGSAENFRLVH